MEQTLTNSKFPSDFLWGSALSSHQVEGNNIYSDWWAWENSENRAVELSAMGRNPSDYRSGLACDFYHRYDKDFAIAKSLNQSAIRISVEWARIESKKGQWEEKEILHYIEMLKSAKRHGLKTFVTLFHFTLPQWFAQRGGFLLAGNVGYFLEFAKKLAPRIAQYVDFWLTINEPEVYTSHAYIFGLYPPHHKSTLEGWKVVNNLISAHNQVAQALRTLSGKPVSMAYHLLDLQGVNMFSSLNRLLSHYIANEYILNRTNRNCDFIGVNYYNHVHLNWWGRRMHSFSGHQTTDLGWGIHPEGLERVLLGLKKYQKPVYITENGLADAQDTKRVKFIFDHLQYIQRAISKGVDVRGYMYWSLLDNFEWHHGFWPRFGLVEIDYKTLNRKIRQSAFFYAEICKNNSL